MTAVGRVLEEAWRGRSDRPTAEMSLSQLLVHPHTRFFFFVFSSCTMLCILPVLLCPSCRRQNIRRCAFAAAGEPRCLLLHGRRCSGFPFWSRVGSSGTISFFQYRPLVILISLSSSTILSRFTTRCEYRLFEIPAFLLRISHQSKVQERRPRQSVFYQLLGTPRQQKPGSKLCCARVGRHQETAWRYSSRYSHPRLPKGLKDSRHS